MASGALRGVCTCLRIAVANQSVLSNLKVFKRHFHPSALLFMRPLLPPATHEVLGPHNAQYFTPFPQLTREEMEEPPPRVSPEVQELLELHRPSYDGNKWIRPKIKSWQFRKRRKELIQAGHSFPLLPMRDRMLDKMPLVKRRLLLKEERLKKIEENMKMMPQWIAEYKEKKREERRQKREEKEKNKVAMLQIEKLGLHPKDPRAKQILGDAKAKQRDVEKKKKKFGKKKEETSAGATL